MTVMVPIIKLKAQPILVIGNNTVAEKYIDSLLKQGALVDWLVDSGVARLDNIGQKANYIGTQFYPALVNKYRLIISTSEITKLNHAISTASKNDNIGFYCYQQTNYSNVELNFGLEHSQVLVASEEPMLLEFFSAFTGLVADSKGLDNNQLLDTVSVILPIVKKQLATNAQRLRFWTSLLNTDILVLATKDRQLFERELLALITRVKTEHVVVDMPRKHAADKQDYFYTNKSKVV